MKKQQKAIILWNNNLKAAYYHIGLKCDNEFAGALPGQFVMLGTSKQKSPFLRRPFSIYEINNNDGKTSLEILYQVVGSGTRQLAGLQSGDSLSLLGPLGKGFSFAPDLHDIFLVAGGIGIAPLHFLAKFFKKNKINLNKSTLFLGGRSTQDLINYTIFQSLGMDIKISTDDGTSGTKGLVTELLEQALKTKPPQIIYSCGPGPMLAQVARLAKQYKVNCRISMETLMACGMGACLGCAVKTGNDNPFYPHICIDGPVFNTKDINLDFL